MGREDTQFKPGNKGGPGTPRGPRLTTRLFRYIKEHGHKNDITTAWLGAALGDEKLLNGRKPNYQFFKEMLDRADGKIPDVEPQVDVSMEAAAAIESIGNPSDTPEGGESSPPNPE